MDRQAACPQGKLMNCVKYSKPVRHDAFAGATIRNFLAVWLLIKQWNNKIHSTINYGYLKKIQPDGKDRS